MSEMELKIANLAEEVKKQVVLWLRERNDGDWGLGMLAVGGQDESVVGDFHFERDLFGPARHFLQDFGVHLQLG